MIGETVGNAMVDDVLYVAVTDVQVVEKAKQGVEIRPKPPTVDSGQGWPSVSAVSRGWRPEEIPDTGRQYHNQANLDIEKAKTLLASGLTRSLANLF
ncbi:MAG: complement resistance protein TraT [Nitrospirales bacterium]